MHEQNFLVVSVFSNLPWLPRNLKMSKMKLLNAFQLATLLADVSIAMVQASADRFFFCICCAMT